MDKYKEVVEALIRFRDERDWAQFHDSKNLALALLLEASELNELFLWKKESQAEEVNPERLKEELADVLTYSLLLAEKHHLDIFDIVLEKIRRMPNNTISMEKLKQIWYGGRDGSHNHYDSSRYYALNLHAVFSKGTLEWRCFESTLHAGKVRANITLALAISAQAINQKCTQMRKTEITENPAFTFRTFLLRLGLIGPEYNNVREHLLANLEGDRAWRYDRSQYECLNRNHRAEDAR